MTFDNETATVAHLEAYDGREQINPDHKVEVRMKFG